MAIAATPVTIYPDPQRPPLATLQAGEAVRVVADQGDWLRIVFRDRNLGERYGYVPSAMMRPEAEAAAEVPERVADAAAPPMAQSSPPTISKSDQDQEETTTVSVGEPISRNGLYIHGGGGGLRTPADRGVALVGGLTARLGPTLFDVNPLDVVLSQGDSYPYYRDTFSDGRSRCRNRLNGQFASDEDCIAVDAAFAVSGSASLIVPGTPVFVGAAIRRRTEDVTWLGTIGGIWHPTGRSAVIIRASAGDGVIGATASFGWKLLP